MSCLQLPTPAMAAHYTIHERPRAPPHTHHFDPTTSSISDHVTGQEVVRMRACVVEYLKDYVLYQPLQQAIALVIDLIDNALDTAARYPGQERHITYNVDLKPVVCSVQKWRPLVLALGLTVEEPDRNLDVRLCGVYVMEGGCKVALLQWTRGLLAALQGLDLYTVRDVLTLTPHDATILSHLLGVSRGLQPPAAAELGALWDRHPGLLQRLGYLSPRGEGPGEGWRPPAVAPVLGEQVAAVLRELYAPVTLQALDTAV